MTLALPSSPHWAPTTTVTGMANAPRCSKGTWQEPTWSGPIGSSAVPVLRRMTWSAMSEDDRRSLCRRGLEAIFDPDLKAAIGRIIDDVRERGDDAVCRALRQFDGVSLEPHQLRVTTD